MVSLISDLRFKILGKKNILDVLCIPATGRSWEEEACEEQNIKGMRRTNIKGMRRTKY